jgi:uncharacterized protein YecT (DUF1311 family)
MRPLQVSIAAAASAVLLAACDAGPHTASGNPRARESSLARDLEVAVARPSGHDTVFVTESTSMLDSSSVAQSGRLDGLRASSATNVSSHGAPSAEGNGPSCESPAADDQRRCLMEHLATSDVLLDRYYQALILRLKSEAGTTSSATEPPAVQRLRTTQRAWLVYRDDQCRARTRDREGPLWAPVRAQCLAEYSTRRAEELADALAKRKALAPREQPAKSNRADARKSTRHTRTHRR